MNEPVHDEDRPDRHARRPAEDPRSPTQEEPVGSPAEAGPSVAESRPAAEPTAADLALRRLIAELREAEQLARARAERQAVVAELGRYALVEHDFAAVADRAVARMRDCLGVDCVEILQHLPAERELRVFAASGRPPGAGGAARVDDGSGSQAGYTLHVGEPVVVGDLAADSRFRGPAPRGPAPYEGEGLEDDEVVSGVTVVIGSPAEPWGVLGVHSRSQRSFTGDDVTFVSSVAHTLAAAQSRQLADENLQRLNHELHFLVEARTREAVAQREFADLLIDSSRDGIFAFDLDSRITRWNRGMERMTGLAASLVTGRRADELFPDHEGSGARARFAATLAGDPVATDEMSFSVAATGKIGWFEAAYAPLRDDAGAVLGGLGVVRDVTERRSAQEALRRSEEQFRSIFRHGPLCIGILGAPDLTVVDMNENCLELFEHGGDGWVGTSFLDLGLWDDDTREQLRSALAADAPGGRFEAMAHFPAGRSKRVLLNAEAVEFGGRRHVMLFIDDITERCEVEEELALVRRRLVDLQEEERLEVAHYLHDFVIQDLLSVGNDLTRLARASGDGETASQIGRHRQTILDLVAHLRETVRDLRPPGLSEFGLAVSLKSFVEQFAADVGADGPVIHFREELGDLDIPPLAANALYRTAQEALRNAVRHAGAERVEVRLEQEGACVRLLVIDDGSGFVVPDRLYSLVFDDHFGLIGAHERLAVLGGRLRLASDSDSGTTVDARVPLDRGGWDG